MLELIIREFLEGRHKLLKRVDSREVLGSWMSENLSDLYFLRLFEFFIICK